MDRLLNHVTTIDGSHTSTLQHTYNEIGELISKNLDGVQTVDYDYNIRGWLTKINGGPDGLTGNDKFALELQYATGTNAKYNGNIGQMLWKANGGTGVTTAAQNYQYSYDNLNRLKSADYAGTGNFDVSNITYDKNGNVEILQRNTIDNLNYDYYGNRLTRVEDATSNTGGFEDVSSTVGTQEYRYDKNGNMLSDTNKGISTIAYNYLNLPQQVTLDDNTIITYTYDAAGLKHRKTVDDGSPETTTYSNGFHYKGNNLQFLQHAEGRARYNSGSWLYEYNLTDHLGNVRVSVNESGGVVQRDGYYPFGGQFNSWTSGTENFYKYNRKEEQKELETYDYGWRQYDPWLGRFSVVDAYADKYYDMSPYQYAANNPILNIDVNGDSVWVTSNSVTDDNGNTTINHTIHVSGKVLKQGSGSLKSGDLARILNERLNEQSSSTTSVDDFGRTTTTNVSISGEFTAAASMDEVSESDHLVVIVDDVEGTADPTLGGGDAGGRASRPGQISYVQSDQSVETAFHEVGHNLGLSHPSANSSSDPMSYTGHGANFSPSQMTEILNNSIRGTPNSGSNSVIMGNAFPGIPRGSFGTSTTTRPFQVAPGPRDRVPRPSKSSGR